MATIAPAGMCLRNCAAMARGSGCFVSAAASVRLGANRSTYFRIGQSSSGAAGGLTVSSAIRVFGAFVLACVTAVPIGVLMGVSRVARGLLDPPIEFYRPLPPLAYLPLVVIWFGIDETAKLIVIWLACFAPIAMAARAGVRSATVEQINAAWSLGANFRQIVLHVVNHATHHRGQVVTMLRQLGRTPTSIDLILYYRETSRA